MSKGAKRTWRSKDTWSNLGFRFFRDSREWRYLLELNQGYDIRYKPAPGVAIFVSGDTGEGKNNPSNATTPGLLIQPDINLDLRTASLTNPESQVDGIFPWNSFDGYVNRLGEYTAMSLLSPDRTNGFSIDSPQASQDTQRG